MRRIWKGMSIFSPNEKEICGSMKDDFFVTTSKQKKQVSKEQSREDIQW